MTLNSRLEKLEPVKLAVELPVTIILVDLKSDDSETGEARVVMFADGASLGRETEESEGAFLSRFYRGIAPTGSPHELSGTELNNLIAGKNEAAALMLWRDKSIPAEVVAQFLQSQSAQPTDCEIRDAPETRTNKQKTGKEG